MRIWSWYNFSEYLVLQFDDFKLLMGLRIIKKKKKSETFLFTNWVRFHFFKSNNDALLKTNNQ